MQQDLTLIMLSHCWHAVHSFRCRHHSHMVTSK